MKSCIPLRHTYPAFEQPVQRLRAFETQLPGLDHRKLIVLLIKNQKPKPKIRNRL